MTSVLRRILPGSSTKSEDHDDEYSVEYSFAMEYLGPPISHEIPHVVPVDIHQIPTASEAASAVIYNNLSLPVIQPIVKSGKKLSHELKPGLEVVESNGPLLVTDEILDSDEVYARKSENGCCREGTLGVSPPTPDVLHGDPSTSTSGTTVVLDGNDDSNTFSGDSDVEDFYNDSWASVSHDNSLQPSTSDSRRLTSRPQEISSEAESCEGEEYWVDETSGQGSRTAVVTFRDLPSSDATSEESDHDEFVKFPEKPVISDDGPKGLCHRCHKRNRFAEKEVCIVCGLKYCSKCVLRAMGSMPEGRKCISCIGYRIDESKRNSLGKCSRMLKSILTNDAIKQIMSSEISCEANQLPPHLIYVNEKTLSIEELVLLQNCPNPPKNLRPGKYWYDRVSGFWGKEGEQPCQIISAELEVGYQIKRTASNGKTNVVINNREVTKAEIWMLKAAGIRCDVNTHFWLAPDGLCQLEGMNNVVGSLWEKRRVKIVCSALSLPFPSDSSKPGGSGVAKETEEVNSKNLEAKSMNKLLLVGCDQSGTSTIFKQAKIVYKVHFSEDEKQDMKFVIQRNLYRYLAILLEGNEIFEREYSIQANIQRANEPGPSEISDQVVEENIYSLSPKLKAFANWLLKVTMSGNLEAIFPAATREYSPLVTELWKDKAFQATYRRRSELDMPPTAANYFLDRAVEISRVDYEPSEMDILHAEGITASNGVASMEFSFPKTSQDGYMETLDQNDPSTSYQLIRAHASSLGENCKWLEMFEDIDLVIYCVSLTDYDEYYEDMSGIRTNKMLETKNHFETIVTHPTLADKNFLLILNKFDLLEEKLEHAPLRNCEWFHDFNPVISLHPHSITSNNNPPLPQRAFHYIAVKFKRLFTSVTGKKLFVSMVIGLEPDSVDKALRYSKEIFKWQDEINTFFVDGSERSSESMEPSSSM
ncbi:extra-large guanine nucleotide-binding protein 1-like [Dorcoceras hygrometricum]|uniref:Extra-large guanine nucleotide-binding protein 1-like n=1 Tax=Dorcoceras hygrometricum TaxID=472368 RepID=A0A2Z7C675_9LAMI|nr:extra-large guanine nucleotide-binding protein 1-like [Dorcoceras hygrometricum]